MAKKQHKVDYRRLDEDLFLLEELLQEEMYEQSEKYLNKFFINFWNTFDPQPLVANWHIGCLCEHIQACLQRQIRRMCINIPPRSSKSTTASISAPPWWWINNPHEKFWLISHSQRLFIQNIVYARRILEHPLYKDRWCNPESEHFRYKLSGDVNTKLRIENTDGGYILGGSPTSGALGMGYTVAVLDDILDSEEANSKVAIENVNNWFTQTFLNRSNDVKNDVVIIVMQRLAEGDLTDYVTQKYGDQDWFVLNLPAKYDPERTFISPIGFNDIRTKRNELLDPVRLPDEFLLTQAKNPLIYNTRYQQNPSADSEGNLVKAEWLQETSILPINYSVMITVWDLNFNETPTSTYTVGLVVGKFEDKYYIVDMFRKQCEITSQLDAIRLFKKKYPKSIIGIEAKANGHAAMSLLKREIHNIYAFEPRKFGGSKEQRLASVLDYFRGNKVFIYSPFEVDDKLHPSFNPDTIKSELKSFPLGKHDDIVDTVSYAIQYLAEYGQESMAMISKGEKIILQDEDITMREWLKGSYNKNTFMDSSNSFTDEVATRDFILNEIPW